MSSNYRDDDRYRPYDRPYDDDARRRRTGGHEGGYNREDQLRRRDNSRRDSYDDDDRRRGGSYDDRRYDDRRYDDRRYEHQEYDRRRGGGGDGSRGRYDDRDRGREPYGRGGGGSGGGRFGTNRDWPSSRNDYDDGPSRGGWQTRDRYDGGMGRTRSRSRDGGGQERERDDRGRAGGGGTKPRFGDSESIRQSVDGDDGRRRSRFESAPRFGAPQQRKMETREQLASQWLEQNAASDAAAARRDGNHEKRKREIHIGNLQSGQIGATSLCDLLNDVLRKVVPEACHAVGNLPPVLSIVMDAQQKFAHMELRSSALATAALGLDQIFVLGRPLKITRPAGYFEDPDEKREILNVDYILPAPSKLQEVYDKLDARKSAEELAAKEESAVEINKAGALASGGEAPAGEATTCLCLENMVDAETLLSGRERRDLRHDVEDECAKFGAVKRVLVPTPSDEDVDKRRPSKAYVRFELVDSAKGAFQLMHGRTFGGRRVEARYVSEKEFEDADSRK